MPIPGIVECSPRVFSGDFSKFFVRQRFFFVLFFLFGYAGITSIQCVLSVWVVVVMPYKRNEGIPTRARRVGAPKQRKKKAEKISGDGRGGGRIF